MKHERGRFVLWLTVSLVVLVVFLFVGAMMFAGALLDWDWFYFREQRAITRLAGEIPGVRILEVEGNHDLTLEGIWLDMEYQGERLHFLDVTADSFDEVEHLDVSQVGDWNLAAAGVLKGRPPTGGNTNWVGCSLDFGPEGDIGRSLSPPIRSIPEFLQRLPEVREIIASLPSAAPGRIVGSDVAYSRVAATGKLGPIPLDVWAFRMRSRE